MSEFYYYYSKVFSTLITLTYFRLVQRDREGVDEIWPDITHVWNRLKGVVYHHAPDQCAVFDNDVFSLHVGVRHNPPRDGEPAHPSNVFQPPFQLP